MKSRKTVLTVPIALTVSPKRTTSMMAAREGVPDTPSLLYIAANSSSSMPSSSESSSSSSEEFAPPPPLRAPPRDAALPPAPPRNEIPPKPRPNIPLNLSTLLLLLLLAFMLLLLLLLDDDELPSAKAVPNDADDADADGGRLAVVDIPPLALPPSPPLDVGEGGDWDEVEGAGGSGVGGATRASLMVRMCPAGANEPVFIPAVVASTRHMLGLGAR